MPHLFGQKRFDPLHLVIQPCIDPAFKALQLIGKLMVDFDLLALEARKIVCQRLHLVLECIDPCRLVDLHIFFFRLSGGGLDLLLKALLQCL